MVIKPTAPSISHEHLEFFDLPWFSVKLGAELSGALYYETYHIMMFRL